MSTDAVDGQTSEQRSELDAAVRAFGATSGMLVFIQPDGSVGVAWQTQSNVIFMRDVLKEALENMEAHIVQNAPTQGSA